MPPEERARLDRNVERWQAMSAEERERMRERWERFRALPAEEQKRLVHERSPTN